MLEVNKTNKNDVILLMGRAHATSINNENKWIYFERTITRGKMHKLGQNVLKNNNVLELQFNKYGVLVDKQITSKDNMQKVKYSKMETKSTLTQQSFVNQFLQSVRQKMYGKRKF
jgi:outer membrane protein assembly factor BamE (lipoprotein component of BamABCDE complex)